MSAIDSSSFRRAVAYLRVSTDEQAERGVSLAVQRERVESYARLYGIELVAVVEDAGASARTLDRPGLQLVLAMVRAGEADAVLVAAFDRLTRSVKDLGHLVEAYFSDGRVDLLSVNEQIDTKSAVGRLVLNVLGAVAQWERETISERVAVALQHKAARGEYTGGGVPFGHVVTDDGRLTSDAGEAEVVGLARELKAEGASLRAVSAELAARGHVSRSGRPFAPTQVLRMLARAA